MKNTSVIYVGGVKILFTVLSNFVSQRLHFPLSKKIIIVPSLKFAFEVSN